LLSGRIAGQISTRGGAPRRVSQRIPMPRKSRKNVGLIGLGIIGTRVAQSLRASGFQVFVWNRTPKPAPNFLGSPAEVAEVCDLLQIFVADSQALFEVIDSFGDALTANHVIVCSATVGPEATVEAARIVRGKGARFLDAPFTGSKGAAEKGELVYYVGGDEATFKKVEPILKATSKAIVRCGEIGHAAVLKVVTNMITAVTTQTLAEALAIVKKSGLAPAALGAAIEHNACRSGVTDLKLPKMIAGDYEPHFSLKHMFKDVQLAIHMANSLEIEVPATTVTAGVMYGALNNGWADLDFASVFKLYDDSFPEPEPEVLMPSVAAPAQIEAPKEKPVIEEKPAASEVAPVEAKIETVPVPPAAKPEPSVPAAESDARAMEVVSDVPRNAKLTGELAAETKSDDSKPGESGSEAGTGAEPATEESGNGGEGTKKPFNRIKRFFFSPTGK
jgi:3-hydroxyisobutyrate dehydrogenase-like beta-hydroxyacid dehydrogenase